MGKKGKTAGLVLILALISIATVPAFAGQFYLKTAGDESETFGPFDYKPGNKVDIAGTVYTLATSQRASGDSVIEEIYLRDDATGSVDGPFPLVNETGIKVGDRELFIVVSPFSRWKIRRSYETVMWTWQINNGTRTRSYGKNEGKKYVFVTARMSAKDAFSAVCSWTTQIAFDSLFKQLFATNVKDDEFALKLAETRLGENGPKPFTTAVIPRRSYSLCFWAFVVPDGGKMDKLIFDGETYVLPEPDPRVYDQLLLGEEIWEEMPNRYPRGAIDPDRDGIVLAPVEEEPEKEPEEEPEPVQSKSAVQAGDARFYQPEPSPSESDIEAKKRAILNRSKKLERRKLSPRQQ